MIFEMRTYLLKPGTVPAVEEAFAVALPARLKLSPLAGLGMHDDDGKKSVLGGGAIVGDAHFVFTLADMGQADGEALGADLEKRNLKARLGVTLTFDPG